METLSPSSRTGPGTTCATPIDYSRVSGELGWKPSVTFEEGLRKTVEWYLANPSWWEPLMADRYGGERLGLGRAHLS